MGQGARKPDGDDESKGMPNQQSCRGQQSSGSRPRPATHHRQSLTRNSHGEGSVKIENVLERVYDRRRLQRAWQQVKRNAGAAGIDQMTIDDFAARESELLELIHKKLEAGIYRFKPARRALIPKPGTTKKRKLGIPVVMDRIVSHSLATVLEEIFDPGFTKSNFGFRRGKSQHRAVEHLRRAVVAGYEWCAAVDLQSFFDEIPHGLILKLIRRKIRDERLVTLIARALKAGVVVEGKLEKTCKGCPQGSPVSPMLSNIVLNELDHELEKRGHRYCRWADDFVIVVKSERAAERVMTSITSYLEDELGLPVNREKSLVAPVHKVEFLSFQILGGKIRVSTKARKRFKDQVRRLTPRNNGWSMYQAIQNLNEYLRGWVGYFRIQEFRKIFRELDEFIRSRLRSMQLKKWKKPKKFQRMMIRLGFPVDEARKTWIKMRHWQSVTRPIVKFVLNLKWFRRQRVLFLDAYTQRNLEIPFAR
jgi:RNA-directed DNA polymerase